MAADTYVIPSDDPIAWGKYPHTVDDLDGRLMGRWDGFSLPLDVPLCSGCDSEIIAGICPDCSEGFVPVVVTDLGDGRYGVAA